MGADRDPGETTTCCTPPSTNTPTAIRAAANALSPPPAPGVAPEAVSGVVSGLAPGVVSGLAPGVVSGEGSFSEVTKPVCHPRRSLT